MCQRIPAGQISQLVLPIFAKVPGPQTVQESTPLALISP